MEAYAIVKTGGKQYMVKAGEKLLVEKLEAEAGKPVALSPVYALSNGQDLTIGRPIVEGATVSAEVVRQLRGPKLISFKKKRRKGYAKKIGHRQALTEIKITSLTGDSGAPASPEQATAAAAPTTSTTGV